jgi:hypothetical protein
MSVAREIRDRARWYVLYSRIVLLLIRIARGRRDGRTTSCVGIIGNGRGGGYGEAAVGIRRFVDISVPGRGLVINLHFGGKE